MDDSTNNFEENIKKNKKKLFYCKTCGKVIDVLTNKWDEDNNEKNKIPTICCGEEMTIIECHTEDAGVEKHLPEVTITTDEDNGRKTYLVKIKIGSVPHPMSEEHLIEWVEVITEREIIRSYFTPADDPEKELVTNKQPLGVRAYCNKHGLWAKKL